MGSSFSPEGTGVQEQLNTDNCNLREGKTGKHKNLVQTFPNTEFWFLVSPQNIGWFEDER